MIRHPSTLKKSPHFLAYVLIRAAVATNEPGLQISVEERGLLGDLQLRTQNILSKGTFCYVPDFLSDTSGGYSEVFVLLTYTHTQQSERGENIRKFLNGSIFGGESGTRGFLCMRIAILEAL